ncbi:hypothetical protein DFH29DRAFT_513380 [Suillus ampliporus]|nr:hypothetical protein DFH29DRAFT_513380 [Suillus ampliporus]
MEESVGHLLSLNEDQTSPTMDFERNEIAEGYTYAPQLNAPYIFDRPAGGVPLNLLHQQHFHQLPFNEMSDTEYLGHAFDAIMSGPAAQDRIHYRNNPVEPPLSHFQPVATLPAPPTALANPMTSGLRTSPRHSPGATSRISGPSTLSTLNTSGVTLYSHSPTSSLNRASQSQSPGFPGPGPMTGTSSRQSPISPLQKRVLILQQMIHWCVILF